MGYTILMTACIDPSQGTIKVQRSDPKVRLEDYKEGLSFWLNLPDKRIQNIVFIDNSGYPLDELQALASAHSRPVEFISLCSNNYPADVHYGYAELSMIEEAFKRSTVLNGSQFFIKATGRLTFPDISRLINKLPDDYQFAVDCRDRRFHSGRPTVMTTLMLFASRFYKENIVGRSEEMMKLSGYIEDSLFDKLICFKGKEGAILRWPVNCCPTGYAALWHTPKRYDSPKQKAIQAVRAICRKTFPNWWI